MIDSKRDTRVATSAEVSADVRGCRFCEAPLNQLVVDLGLSPLCQSIVQPEDLNHGEMLYPLRAFVCEECWLIQVHDLVSGEDIYSHYAYLSSCSDSWLRHSQNFCDSITERLGLDSSKRVVEVASNDGYL